MTDQEEPAALSDEALEAALDNLVTEVEGATEDALAVLENQEGIETRAELYQAAGFKGERLTVEVEMYDAELFATMDLLDRVTDAPQQAREFVPAASALAALVQSAPTGTWAEWLAAQEAAEETAEDASSEVDG